MLFDISILLDHRSNVVVDIHEHLYKPVIGADLAQVTGNCINYPKTLSLVSQLIGTIRQQKSAADTVIAFIADEV